MGELSLVAKVTHVPTMYMSESPGALYGKRDNAINGHKEIAKRMHAAGVDTIIVADTHWLVNAGYHVNSNDHFRGIYTSPEFPQFIQDMSYDYDGNPALGDAIAERATAKGVHMLSHQLDSLDLEYGTLVPMRYMNPDKAFKVISVAGWCTVHQLQDSRKVGEAIREAIEASDSKVALLASGSLSHEIWPNELYAANNGTFTIRNEFNHQMDLRTLELWQNGDISTFLKMLPEYSERCCGEGGMHDTAMMFGALGWDDYAGKGELLGEYFPSSGTGQCNVIFPVT